jgi:hypothetical protein
MTSEKNHSGNTHQTKLETSSEKGFTKKHKIVAALSGVALLAGIGGGIAAANMNSEDKSPVAEAPAGQNLESNFPLPKDPDYDPFAEIGDNSNIAIADIDQLLGYFTSSDLTREALTSALSQADQTEVDRIFEVIGNYDSSDNIEVTHILDKYGLKTGEIPMDLMGRISEKNNFTEGEYIDLTFGKYPGLPSNDIKNALIKFTQEEIDIAREVMEGYESKSVLNNLLRDYGVEIPSGY